MGTDFYIARDDNKTLFDLGRHGFWFGEMLDWSDNQPHPIVPSDLESLTPMVRRAFGHLGEGRVAEIADRIRLFIGDCASPVITDEYDRERRDWRTVDDYCERSRQ
jgi:hypothetical protein